MQQIIGATNNLHRRSGNVLPPPADECTNRNISLTAKNDSKSSNVRLHIIHCLCGKFGYFWWLGTRYSCRTDHYILYSDVIIKKLK